MSVVVTRNPATGEELATYDAHDEAGVEAALSDVHAASQVWSATPLADRLALLRGVGKLLTERREEYAALITAEMASRSPRRSARSTSAPGTARSSPTSRPAGSPTTRSSPPPRGRGCRTSPSASSSP